MLYHGTKRNKANLLWIDNGDVKDEKMISTAQILVLLTEELEN